ncbi:MAG: hypothetical protein Q4C00_01510 [Bacillota bacterium]|nr:hypothetical protein [Bacillota bacterium]
MSNNSEAIINWLYQYENIDVDTSISTEQLAANAMAYALYKTPQKQIRSYVDGSENITEYFNFLVRQPSQLEAQRRENQVRLDDIECWIRQQNFSRNLPKIEGCYHVAVSHSFCMEAQDEKESVYQLTIEVKYERKKA